MKTGLVIFFVLAASILPSDATLNVQTPITRVVNLLKGLSKKTEMEGKMEEKLYEKFVCWAKGVIDSKTASNAAAQSRKDSLEAYISDIQAGRIEFTSERTDLEAELAGLNKDIDTATTLRNEENAQFMAAEKEMMQAASALDKAMAILGGVTGKYSTGTLLAQRSESQMTEGFAARVQDAADLELAAELGTKTLSAGDAVFLRRLLTGEVPKADWKKLNRKATFKMSYKARSDKILSILTDMHTTFTKNLADARKKEAEALALFNKLMAAKNNQHSQAQQALQKMTAETGARQLSESDAQAEVDALGQQITNDNSFIHQTKAELATKKSEWKARQALRTAEIAAFSKAIEILYNDDARDLMKKSFSSQGYSLVQEKSLTSRATAAGRLESAAALLRKTSEAAGADKRLALFASRIALQSGGQFDTVLQAIDNMVQTLKDEENTDLAQKEQCEKDRATDTRTAAKTSREMDEATDSITKLKGEIDDIAADIQEKNQTIAATQTELDEATKLRQAENQEWQASDKDDRDMANLVEQAKNVLETFYRDNGLTLMQQPAQAGKAPPPPPTTWSGTYGGKTEQATGVVATLEIIKADIDKDITTAKAAEDAAAQKYTDFKKKCDDEILALGGEITTLTGTKGDKEFSVQQETATRLNKKGSLVAVMTKISDANQGCEYITVNYPIRLGNRQMEIDGLLKAKAILKGAKFSKGPDPSREVTPGDALFLQRRWK